MEQKSNGALISSIVIIILLVIGGIFLWKTSIKNKVAQPSTTDSGSVTTTTTTNDVSDIENDLNSIDINNLDSGL
ncbi:MAG TPA: hypothetical protein VIH31_02490 [Candidatus Paceibacterota bacterium]